MKKVMKNAREDGQALLIVVMLIAVALTVVLTMSFTSRTDTQVAKLEEENQKALAAAEAGIEAALKQGDVADISTLGFSGFTGSAKISMTSESQYQTPDIRKDESYTFYLGNFDPESPSVINSPDSDYDISIYYKSYDTRYQSVPPDTDLCDDLALEVSIISGSCTNSSNCSINRYLVDKDSKFGGNDQYRKPGAFIDDVFYPYELDDFNNVYKCQSGVFPINNGDLGQNNGDKLMVVKFLSFDETNSTKLVFEGVGSTDLPIQAKVVTSNAKTSTGARKEVQLIQEYPQIPAEIFDTIF